MRSALPVSFYREPIGRLAQHTARRRKRPLLTCSGLCAAPLIMDPHARSTALHITTSSAIGHATPAPEVGCVWQDGKETIATKVTKNLVVLRELQLNENTATTELSFSSLILKDNCRSVTEISAVVDWISA